MKKMFLKLKTAVALLLIIVFGVSSPEACTVRASGTGKVNISLIGKYDSADVAAIRAIDTDAKEIRLRNHATGKTYTLNYDNTSMMYDIYGDVLSPRLLYPGQIVEVTFLKSSKHITTLNVSKDAWVIGDTRKHDLVRNDGTAVVNGEVLKLDARSLIMAEDKLALAEDILSTDSVTVSGVGKDIYSVIVESGHGYVSLSSEVVENQSLVGAWLELDNEVIYKISPNMLISAPEGDYNLQILGNGANYQSKVNVSRNQETVIDTSDVTISRPKEGLVTFNVEPSDAEVFIDGQRILTGVPENIQYGYHNLKVIADGYITQTKYLKVGTPKSVIDITLEKDSSAEEASSETSATSASTSDGADAASTSDSIEKKTVSSNSSSSESSKESDSNKSVSSNSSSSNPNRVIEGYRIYIDKPYDAEIYFDGGYVGLVPCSVTKISGNHEIIVKKEGYETKSYRIHIDTQQTDLKYEFPDMIKIEPKESSSGKSSSSDSSASASTSSKDSSADASSEASSEDSSDSSSSASTEEAADDSSTASSEDSSSDDSSSDSASSASSEEDGSSKETSEDSDSLGRSSSEDGGSSGNTESSDAASTASASSGD